ncbi:MAG: hypothetical protein JKX81_14150, partial [Arenicella sp.]|nr:hypothetical protein [Arenicella sp.]
MNNLKFARSLVFFTLALIFSLPSIAGVRSISNGIDLLENDLTVGKKVMVACTNGFIKRALVKRDTEQKWCDTVLGSVCAINQKVAARLVCTDDYRNQIASQKNGESDRQSDEGNSDSDELVKLKQELMDIELKRLDIADKVLELKRKEL